MDTGRQRETAGDDGRIEKSGQTDNSEPSPEISLYTQIKCVDPFLRNNGTRLFNQLNLNLVTHPIHLINSKLVVDHHEACREVAEPLLPLIHLRLKSFDLAG